ncbi:MAG: OmpA family protein [Archaeoglobaceae archaeon]
MSRRGIVFLMCLGVICFSEVEASEVRGDKLYIKQEVKAYRDDVVRYPTEAMYVISGGELISVEKVREVKSLSLGMEIGKVLKESIFERVAKGGFDEERANKENRVEGKKEEKVYRVFFDFGRWELKWCEKEKLREWVQGEKPKRVRVYGYADVFGGKKFNERLSKKRAEVVKRVLEELGVEVEEVKGMGESNVECVYGLNRVVEVRVVE